MYCFAWPIIFILQHKTTQSYMLVVINLKYFTFNIKCWWQIIACGKIIFQFILNIVLVWRTISTNWFMAVHEGSHHSHIYRTISISNKMSFLSKYTLYGIDKYLSPKMFPRCILQCISWWLETWHVKCLYFAAIYYDLLWLKF